MSQLRCFWIKRADREFLNPLLGWWGSAARGTSENTVLWVAVSIIIMGVEGLNIGTFLPGLWPMCAVLGVSVGNCIQLGKEECLRRRTKIPNTWKECLWLLAYCVDDDNWKSFHFCVPSPQQWGTSQRKAGDLMLTVAAFPPLSDMLGHICLAEFPAPHPCHLPKWK